MYKTGQGAQVGEVSSEPHAHPELTAGARRTRWPSAPTCYFFLPAFLTAFLPAFLAGAAGGGLLLLSISR